jgi:tetratricopeptide (TPR) repeat protein
LFKQAAHILPTLLMCLIFAGQQACKSKKTVQQSAGSESADLSKQLLEVRFGQVYVQACSERIKGNLQEALKLFEECKNMEPDNPAVRYELATIYKLLGMNDQALSNAKFCAEADSRNEWYQLLLIDCYNATKQYAQAVKTREMLVKNFPSKNDFKEDLAIEYAITGQYDKSFKIYDELERTFGLNEQITLNKVKLLKSQKKHRETEAELKKLSASNKSEPRFYAYLAEFYLEQNEPEKAKEMYDRIIAVDPANPTVNLALHDYYSNKGDDKEAFIYLKKAFQNPDLDVGTKASIVGSYYTKAERNSEEARIQGIELAKMMLNLHPEATESNALYGDFLRLEKKNKEAAGYYYKAALNEKRDFRVWDNLLFVDNELARYDSLEKHSNLAMELFPNQPVNYLYNGVANTQLRNYQKAQRSLQDGLEFVIDNKALRIQFLSALGDACFYMKNYEKSDRYFEDALKVDSDNTYVLNNFAYYLSLRNEKLDRAEKLSKKSNELQPNNRNYMDTYGWILFQQKKYSEAEQWLSRAAKSAGKNPTILEHYGDVLFMLNRQQEALKQWEAAKLAGGNTPELNRKIDEKKLDVH